MRFKHLVLGAGFMGLATCFGATAQPQKLPKPMVDADYRSYSDARVKLGQFLFYDRVLSGTYRVSCATCHNHDRASTNGFRLDGKPEIKGDPLATSGHEVYNALKPSSQPAPSLFNLGAKQFVTLFGDGRVSRTADGEFLSPAGKELPNGLQDVLAVQALFPAVTGDELVGTVDNDLKAIAHQGSTAIWNELTRRIRDLPDYFPLFERAFDDVKTPEDIGIRHIANGIGAFVGTEWRSDTSPFDAHLKGDANAMTGEQKRGMELFYGEAKCSVCHGGALQTDHLFHQSNLGLGDKKTTGSSPFKKDGSTRTPSLRNVAKTAPYGRLANVATLREAIDIHIERGSGFGKGLTRAALDELVSFLEALTDDVGLKGRLGKPREVPSSLVVD